jgi:3-oxoacyl-[acyl-carrier protein] reductase
LEGRRVAAEINKAGDMAEYSKMDVTKADDWKAVVAFAQSQFTRVDILVNNAGWTYRRKDTTLVSETDYDSK